MNIQFNNVGNIGDIVKHVALVNLLKGLVEGSPSLSPPVTTTYIDCHTFLTRAPFPKVKEWKNTIDQYMATCSSSDPEGSKACYERYVAMQDLLPEFYRCSSGMALKYLRDTVGRERAVGVLSEMDPATRATLEDQLREQDLMSMVEHIMHHSTELEKLSQIGNSATVTNNQLFCLVDPFLLEVEEWSHIQSGLAKHFSGSKAALMLVFTYDRSESLTPEQVWQPFEATDSVFLRRPVAWLQAGKVHLALYCDTDSKQSALHIVRDQLGWTEASHITN